MNPRIIIQEELSQISPRLMELPEVHPYVVQDGYFEELPNQMISNIRTDNMSAGEEIMQLSPVLAGLKEKETYQIEHGYFAQQTIALHEIQPNAAKIISVKYWRRLAIAASLTGILGLSVFLYSQYGKSHDLISSGLAIKTEAQFNQKLSELDAEEIMKYLNQYASVYDRDQMDYMIDPNHLPDETEYFNDPTLNELIMEVNDTDINM